MKMTTEQLIEKAMDLNQQLREILNEISEQEDSLIDQLELSNLLNSDEITDDIRNDLMDLQSSIE